MQAHLIPLFVVALALGAQGAAVVPIVEIFGHNEKDNFGGEIEDVINGSGMNGNGIDGDPNWPTGAGDPATWTITDPYPSATYQSERQSASLLDVGSTGKIGWTILDLGSEAVELETLYLWHVRENSGRVATSYNVYLASNPTVAPTHGPTNDSAADYDFSSGGWSSVSGSPFSGTQSGTSQISLAGASARYIGIEILSNGGDSSRVGFQEAGVSAIPEPSIALLGALGFLGLLRRRK